MLVTFIRMADESVATNGMSGDGERVVTSEDAPTSDGARGVEGAVISNPPPRFDPSVVAVIAAIIAAAGVIGGVGVGACSYVRSDIASVEKQNANTLKLLGDEHAGMRDRLLRIETVQGELIAQTTRVEEALSAHRTTVERTLEDMSSRLEELASRSGQSAPGSESESEPLLFRRDPEWPGILRVAPRVLPPEMTGIRP